MSLDKNLPAIQVSSLTRLYGALLAVDHLHFTVNACQIYGLLGPNGAGKTTTIKMLTTLLKPSKGTAIIAGYDITKAPRMVRAHIGYVPQLLSADGGLTGYENLMLSARLYNLAKKEAVFRIEEMLTLMDLLPHAHSLVNTYSGGMIRKLEIAQALLHRPAVLFLDEPTIGLDVISRRVVWERLKQLTTSLKLAILITTHDMQEAEELCDALAILESGKIVAEGTKSALKKQVGEQATLQDVFMYFCKSQPESASGYHHAKYVRKTIGRLG